MTILALLKFKEPDIINSEDRKKPYFLGDRLFERSGFWSRWMLEWRFFVGTGRVELIEREGV